ncbi:YesL family protein [Gracilibacillus salinarum]|uniref:DUF624 domain-containing protein n=1 Tax=Gracilibacillus salinarum TaxID=2932255 RepID=A0ABY4GIE9_9BACI|nr:DUF624 domain-containing protein [Gracilibacillus salinarum]UOQ84128.1 DUF624 domain-containing protein [Gracilibacillus salinarum]
MEINGIWGVFYAISRWLTQVVVANLLWFVFNLPVIIVMFNILMVRYTGELILFGLLLVMVLPLVFFPATVALFAVMRGWIMDKDMHLFSSYWRYYKANYKRSAKGGCFVTLIWSCLILNFFLIQINDLAMLTYLFYVVAFIIFVFSIHYFSLIVHYQSTTFSDLKNAMLLTLINPILTIEILIVSGLSFYLALNFFSFAFPFFIGSVIAYVSFLGFYRYLTKIDVTNNQREIHITK